MAGFGCPPRAMLVNEAADAAMARIATPADIDTAMVKGTGYPVGPLEWADELSPAFFLNIRKRPVMDALTD